MKLVDNIPVIETERLRLRPFTLDDAPEVQRLAGEWEVASPTLEMPHPYEDGMAEQWISTHNEMVQKGDYVFAITKRKGGVLIGAIAIWAKEQYEHAEMGYWIGLPFWNHGYCTEAAQSVLRFGFELVGLNRIYACPFNRNPASGRVLEKIGMKHEGYQKQHVKRWDKFEDMKLYGMLQSDYYDILNNS
jgi:ribosomal-protein-alanine N-acetyltransferase